MQILLCVWSWGFMRAHSLSSLWCSVCHLCSIGAGEFGVWVGVGDFFGRGSIDPLLPIGIVTDPLLGSLKQTFNARRSRRSPGLGLDTHGKSWGTPAFDYGVPIRVATR